MARFELLIGMCVREDHVTIILQKKISSFWVCQQILIVVPFVSIYMCSLARGIFVWHQCQTHK